MNITRLVFLLFFILTFSIETDAQSAEDGVTVTEDGYGNILDENIDRAKDEALTDALRGAVANVMGLMTDSKDLGMNDRLVEQYIFSETIDYIMRYEIIASGNLDELSYFVTARVKVDSDRLERNLDKIGILTKRLSSPKIVLFIHEQLSDTRFMSVVMISENVVMMELKKSGLELVRKDRIDGKDKSSDEMYKFDRYRDSAITIANELRADIVVVGNSSVEVKQRKEFKQDKINNVLASVELIAIKLDNGKILVESSDSAAYFHANIVTAAERAIRKASVKAAKALRDEIQSRWSTEVNAGRKIVFTVERVTDLALFNNIKNSLKYYLQGNIKVESRAYSGNRAEFNVIAPSTGHKMAAELEGKKFAEFNIKILSSSLDTLNVALIR